MKKFLLLLFSLLQLSLLANDAVEEYLKRRSQLISEVNQNYFASNIILSEQEKEVDKLLLALIGQELEKPYAPQATPFIEVQAEIEKSELYQLLKKMPKGALLHAHATSLGDFHWLAKTAISRDDCYMYLGEPSGKNLKGSLGIYEKRPSENWHRVKELRALSESVEDFDQKIYDSFTLHKNDFSHPAIWDRFSSCFHHSCYLFNDRSLLKSYLKNAMLKLLCEDHVMHLELRDIIDDSRLALYQEIVDEIHQSHPEFSLKIIGYVSRNKEPPRFSQAVKDAIFLAKKYPHLLIGFDLTGDEDAFHRNLYYINELEELLHRASDADVTLPLFLHSGESLLPMSGATNLASSNDNLYDALLLKAKRVGHAISLIKNPALMEKFREQKIALELCPISNQSLHYTKDLRMHPALSYMSAGLLVTLNSDDPAIFGYEGITADFYEACVAWQLDLRAIKQLVLNSISASACDAKEKEALKEHWQADWDAFIARVSKSSK